MGRTGLSRSTIYAKIAAGEFPEPISLGARAVGWLSDDVEAWLVARVEASRRSDPERQADGHDDGDDDDDDRARRRGR